jgi:hypothetical protein
MPTTLPDTAARSRERRRRLSLELVPLIAALLYLAILGWDMAALEADFSTLFGPIDRAGAYNPMEPMRPSLAEPR